MSRMTVVALMGRLQQARGAMYEPDGWVPAAELAFGAEALDVLFWAGVVRSRLVGDVWEYQLVA
jgi:hypothetical protein